MADTVSTGAQTAVTATTTSLGAVTFQLPDEAEVAAAAFRLPPNRAVEIKVALVNFTKPPKTAKFELFAAQPPATGGKPVATVNATTKTATEASGSFTFDPKKHKLTSTAFVRATADGAPPVVAQVGVDTKGAFDLKWDKAGPLVRPGQAVTLRCRFVGYPAPTNAKFELFPAHETGFKNPKGPAPTPFKTLTPTEKGDVLTADFTIELPPDAPPPAEGKLADMPGIFFVVKIDKDHALSPVQPVLPDLEVRFEPGDPNWLFEPIVGKKATFKGEGQPGAADPDKNPDSKSGKFPNRVLGIKQRLQALGFYYETLPALTDAKGRNRQTRVFRKCVRWYWKHVSPGPDKKDPIPMIDEAGYNPAKDDEQPPRGPRRVDFDKFKDEWFQDLEKRVREGLYAQDPPADKKDPPPAAGELDFAREVKLVGPGDLATHQQEHIIGAAAKPAPVDWTRELTKAPYDRYQEPLAFKPPLKHGDIRNQMEEIHFARNPALLRLPIVARTKMKRKDGKTVDGPADGFRVLFQLVAVNDDISKDPPYLDVLDLRATSRVVNRLGAFGTPTPAAKAGDPPPKGPRTYVKEVVERFKTATKAAEADPTWWNATSDFGGKRSDKVGVVGATGVLPVGANGRLLGALDDAAFPWSALDATKKNAAHQTTYARSVSVPLIGGRAALVLSPSRRGGDSYRVRAFVEPPKVPGAPAPASPPTPVGEKTTAALTVWRRVRITRYFQKKVPADWSADSIKELGGPLEDIDWKRVAEIYKQAFLIIEPPAEKRELTKALRDEALKRTIAYFTKLAPLGATGHNLVPLRRRNESATPPPQLPLRNLNPTLDYARLWRHVDAAAPDTPFMFDIREQDEYLADAGKAANTHAGFRTDAAIPSPYYSAIVADFILWAMVYMPVFLDEDDPPGSTDFDPVPAPGLTCLQSLMADNVTGSRGAGWCTHFPANSNISTGGDLLKRTDPSAFIQRSRGGDIQVDYTHENGGTFRVVHTVPTPPPNPTIGDSLDSIRAVLRGLGTQVPTKITVGAATVDNPAVVDGRVIFELGPTTLTAATEAPVGEINPSGNNGSGIPFVFSPKDAAGNFTGKTAPLLLKDGTPAKATSSLADLQASPANNVRPWASLDRDDGTRRLPPLPGTPTTVLHTRVLPPPAGGFSLGDLVLLFGQIGCTSHEVLADGSVQIKFPSAKKATKPKLVLSGFLFWYSFSREDLGGNKFRFTSEGVYRNLSATTNFISTFNEANPAATPLNFDLSDMNEGITLSPGDIVRVNRFRLQDDLAAGAKRKLFDDVDPLDPSERVIFKTLDFVYGDGVGQNGKTIQKWCDFVQANLAKLSRDGDIVSFKPRHTFPLLPAGQASWFFFRQKAVYGKFAMDALNLEIVIERTTNDPDTGRKRIVRDAFLPFDAPRNFAPLEMFPSGIAPGHRSFWLFFGRGSYKNEGTRGPDPANKRGQGFRVPSGGLSYDLGTNAAHELGHSLYLRHHFTGNRFADIADHDHDDLCFMGYFTSWTDQGGGKKGLGVTKEDWLDGKNRETGRADACGRCMLKLRGWHVGHDPKHIPQNAPAGSNAFSFPLAKASFIADWPGAQTGGGGNVGPSPVPPQPIPPKPKPPIHRDCTEVSGGHFDFDRSFVRKDGVLALAKVHQSLGSDPTSRAMIFGHTDTVGTEEYNKLLSERRAKSVLAVLTHDADFWESLHGQESWGLKPVQIMLNAVRPPADAAIAEDDIAGPETTGALKRFQGRAGIGQSGQNDKATRRALYVEYFKVAGAQPVGAARFKDFGGTRCMGCSEYNPFSASGKDEASRRVEVMIFDPADDPADLPCTIGAVGPCRANLLKAGETAEKTPPGGGNFKCKVYLKLSALCPGASA